MTTSNSTLTLTDAGELIAAIPAMLGFMPQDSLVVIAHRDRTLGVVIRTDLPPVPLDDDFADQLLRPVIGQQSTGASMVLIGGPPAHEHYQLVEEIRARFEGMDLPLLHAVHVPEISGGAPWLCIDHDDCHGTVADPESSPVNALATLSGAVVHPSRAAVEQQIDRAPKEVLKRRALLLTELSAATEPATASDTADMLAALHTIDAAADAVSEGKAELSDEQLVGLAVAISCGPVRDAVLIADTAEQELALRKLWTTLTSELPDPECAEAACLLGVSAYLEGDGAFAGIALRRAIESNPEHELANLLMRALYGGISPGSLRLLLKRAAERARAEVAGEPCAKPA